ncbi:MAG: pyridoxal phosphate-dependent aminotransferase [Erysipelotrichales bacterium]|nr:pyridoxal phosphate-dependent aminotransferase [Erysipelotrichales bacterium]
MRYNERLNLVEESGIRKYREYAKSRGLLDFTIGDTCINTSSQIKYGVIKDLINNHTHYETTQGNEEVRKLVSEKEHVLNFSEKEVLLTVGATEGIYVTLTALLNIGDEVIIFKPYYSLYKNVVLQNGGKIIEVDALNGIKTEELERNISATTLAIILNIPSNPTGLIYSEDMEKIVRIVQQNNIYLIVDATYDELIYDNLKIEYEKLLPIRDKLIIVKSMSKSHSMTGFRLGYVLADKSIMQQLIKVHQMCVSCIPSVFNSAFIEAINEDNVNIREDYENKRNYVLAKLNEMNLKYIRPEGAFYVCLFVPCGMTSTEYVDELMELANIACVPGVSFGDERIVRVSFSSSWDELIEGMKRLQSYIESKSK